jgi:4-amino-4-deoxy-L-arabinose transferase-like glycosyltransferase
MNRRTGAPFRAGDYSWALAISLIGLSVRLACGWEYSRHPLGRILWVDEEAYWNWARRISASQWLPERPFYQDPLFAYVLSVVMRGLGTDSLATLRMALAVLGALTPPLVYLAGRLGLGRAEGIVAALAAAVYGPLVFTDGLIEKEGLAALVAAAAWALTAWATSTAGGPGKVGLAGVAWGALALLRANALIVAPLGAVWWLRAPGATKRWRALAFLGGFAVPIAPVMLINVLVARPPELLLTTWQAGANFYIGNGPEATGIYVAPDFVNPNPAYEADDYLGEARRRSGRMLTPGQSSAFWFREGLKRWRDAPGASLRLLMRKVMLLLSNEEIADNQSFELARLVAAPVLGWCMLSFGWILPCAAMGLGRWERSPFWWFLVLSTGAGLATTVVFFVVGRYRIPWMPGLLLLAACGLVDAARRLVAGRWLGLAMCLVGLALPAALLAWRPADLPFEQRWGQTEWSLFVADFRAGQLEPALDALDDARALGATPAGKMAEMLASGPLHDQLAASLQLAERWDQMLGHSPDADLHRARWLRQLPERRAESRALLAKGLQAHPDDPRWRREWGAWWLGELNDPAARSRAATELARAAEGPRGDPSAMILLALLRRDHRWLDRAMPRVRQRDRPRLQLAREILESVRPSKLKE